ncbi:hypothetical protein BB934_35610 (plasmid) [Microvirga ossetica]|uniref:Uncharacterized protein n=1 Tax=Microvirga ossetica TaxID=1882682 RepID=A0A1B2EUD6_9HYPH|nr:hypothetical protein [Microvirga ossetica]ANY83585.1 hypothetical protein BB934_35610 [Microvirga ossetica]
MSTTLANIDVEYEFELARLRVTAKPDLRAMLMNTVRQRHRERRASYVREIAELQKRMSRK